MSEDELRFGVFETTFPALLFIQMDGLDIHFRNGVSYGSILTFVIAERRALTMTTSLSCFCRTDFFWGDVCVDILEGEGNCEKDVMPILVSSRYIAGRILRLPSRVDIHYIVCHPDSDASCCNRLIM